MTGNLHKLITVVIVTTGVFAIIGHCYSAFLKFKGGKGAASILGLMIFINPVIALIAVFVWLVIFNITHIVSVSTIFMLMSYPISSYLIHIQYFNILVYHIGFLSLFGIIMHKSNIVRLITKSERKTYLFTKNIV